MSSFAGTREKNLFVSCVFLILSLVYVCSFALFIFIIINTFICCFNQIFEKFVGNHIDSAIITCNKWYPKFMGIILEYWWIKPYFSKFRYFSPKNFSNHVLGFFYVCIHTIKQCTYSFNNLLLMLCSSSFWLTLFLCLTHSVCIPFSFR